MRARVGAVERAESAPAPPTGAAPLPDHLAEKVRRAGASLAGERKQVTVLFADVMGSMELAEQTDAEEWRQIMERFFAILCEGVHYFEGTVDKFTGDGIMALFGAPIAHEDHAARGCHAALRLAERLRDFSAELRRARGLNFLVRIGLNSGEVIVGTIGDDVTMTYTAIGSTVGLARRMEAVAEPGKIYLTEHTAALVEGYFDVRDLGEFEIKGVHQPVRVFELAGLGRLRTRLDVSRARGLSRFVGRADEMAALEAALGRADAGSGEVVAIVGEAGIGKSRLCYEFAKGCRERGISVWEAHCRSRGESVPLMPLLELLRSYFAIGEHDSAQAAREKIAGRMLLLDEELRADLPLVFDFLGVPDPARPVPRIDPEARQRRIFATLTRLVDARSERSVAVYQLEDLQWIDPGSEAFLENLIDAVPSTRTLVLANFRPGYRARWLDRSYCGRLALRPLSASATVEMLVELLGDDPSLAELRKRIRERTGGNPFFVEEVVRGLVEGGGLEGEPGAYRVRGSLGTLAIPASVQAVLAARIDRLGEREKSVLEAAAVIGREFAEPVLRRIAGLAEPDLHAALAALVDAELVFAHGVGPGTSYSFTHHLTEEVAYRSQVAERRAATHARVARAIEEVYPDRLDELAALVSHHLEEAGERLGAARWSARAAAWTGFANPREALRNWRKVRDLTDAAGETPETLTMGYWARNYILHFGWRLGAADEEEAKQTFEEARALAARIENPGQSAGVLALYAHMRVMSGEAAEHVDMALEALRLAEKSGDAAVQMAIIPAAAWALFMLGRLREAMEMLDRGVALGASDPTLGGGIAQASPYAWCVMERAQVGTMLGAMSIDEARQEVERALELVREHADLEGTGWVHEGGVAIEWIAGDAERALSHATAGAEIAERIGDALSRGVAHDGVAMAHLLLEDCDRATAELELALDTLRKARTGLCYESWLLRHLAEAHLGAGRPEPARRAAITAIDIARRQQARAQELEAQLVLARVLAASGSVSAAPAIKAALERAKALVEDSEARGLEPFVHEERARLADLTGDAAARERELATARRQFEALGADARAASLALDEPES